MFRSPALLCLLAASALVGCSKSAESRKESAQKTTPSGTAQEPTPKGGGAPEGDDDGEPIATRGGTGDSDGSGAQAKGPEEGTGKKPGTGKVKKPDPTESGTGGNQPTPEQSGSGDDSFQLAVKQPAAVAPGGDAVARIQVTPGPGYKMNAEYPTKLTLETTEGVTIADATLDKGEAESFDDHGLVFAVHLSPQSAGEFSVAGKIKFAVCTDATCDPKRQTVSIKVAAK